MKFDFALNPDLVFQLIVGLDNGGIEAPLSVDDYFLENVDVAALTACGVPFHNALLCPKIAVRSNPSNPGHHSGHQST